MKYLSYEQLSYEEKIQAINTYIAIRSVEEETPEEYIDPSGVLSCSFQRQKDGYVQVNI